MLMERRKRSSAIQKSQNGTSIDTSGDTRHRLVRAKVFRRPFRRMETFFVSFSVVLIGFYCFLYQQMLSIPEVPVSEEMPYRILDHELPYSLVNHSFETVVPSIFLPQRPRTFGYYRDDNSIGAERLDPNAVRLYYSHVMPDITVEEIKKQEKLLDSRKYRNGKADKLETGNCVAQYQWQKSFFPTCNFLMEQDLIDSMHTSLLDHGYWRDVWKLTDSGKETILKTMRFEHDYTPRNYDRHRRDAVAMERLKASPYVLDIYAYCGNSGLFEYASGGSLSDSIYHDQDDNPWSPREKLIVAHQIASGIHAVHTFPKEGVPAIAHTDITPSQFVYVNDEMMFKLNDFNRCRFIPWDKKKEEPCTFDVGSNPGNFRSPEEYKYDPETEKIDMYSIGNVIYGILTGKYPFEKLNGKQARRKIRRGERPPIDDTYKDSKDPYIQSLLKCISMCWVQEPKDRASSGRLLDFITDELKRLDKTND